MKKIANFLATALSVFIIYKADGVTPNSCYVYAPAVPWVFYEIPCWMLDDDVPASAIKKYIWRCQDCARLMT